MPRQDDVGVRATPLAASLLDPIPANRLFGITVVSAEDGAAEVALEVAAPATNVIGSLHSSGLAALADAAGLAAVISAAGAPDRFEGVVPLGREATLEFLAPARGRLVARCTLDERARAELVPLYAGERDRAAVDTVAEVIDADDAVVCKGRFAWSVRRL